MLELLHKGWERNTKYSFYLNLIEPRKLHSQAIAKALLNGQMLSETERPNAKRNRSQAHRVAIATWIKTMLT